MTLITLFLTTMMTVTAAPQPKHSEGLIVIYGSARLAAANADFHGYSLKGYEGGLSAISPAMLGRIAWVRTTGQWLGPFLVVDSVGANDAIDSIYGRHEIAEVTWDTAAKLGFEWGGRWGEIYFDACPPDNRNRPSRPSPYAPPRDYTMWPYRWSSFYPYPAQELVVQCNSTIEPHHCGESQ